MAILGIDEVGRGPWAGPLVVGACVLREEIEGLTDSKKLTARRREKLNEIIMAQSSWGLGLISAAELDEIGLSAALRKAAIEAVSAVSGSHSEIVIDGTVNFLAETGKGRFASVLPKADLLVPAVSAASIIAKVARDRYMVEVAAKFPGYGFEKHVGYGTAAHRKALLELGICAEHRRSFRPIREILGEPETIYSLTGSTSVVGMIAEGKVVEFLKGRGHDILARNWKTSRCEIDVISTYDGRIYFTEVKYRRNDRHGSGLEVVGAKKQKQMRFAAEVYMKNFGVSLEPLLAVASVAGADFRIRDFLVLR